MLLLDMLTELAYSSWGRTNHEVDEGHPSDVCLLAIMDAAHEAVTDLEPVEAAGLLAAEPWALAWENESSIGEGVVGVVESVIGARLWWHFCMNHDMAETRFSYAGGAEDDEHLSFRPPGEWRLVDE